ncbi:MAG: hypothetical protein AAF957_26520 [Planctomycetota bacterium]
MKPHLLPFSTLSLAAALTAAATAQSPIVGVNVRLDDAFMSDTGDFVNNYTQLAGESRSLFAIDFDSLAQTLYAIDNTTLEVVTIDPMTGVSTPTGVVAQTITGATGLTADADGSTWYVSDFDGTNTNLYSGDVTTGAFSLVGVITAGIIIDISIDSNGNLYGFSISDDSLYSIDTGTGAGTLIGASGFAANFAQGMDFDWTDNTLYATIYTGGGTGAFCAFDLVTGVANLINDTTPLNAEMEMAVQVGADVTLGDNYCMANPNSTGATGDISAVGSPVAASNDVTLNASSLPNNAFGFFLTSQTQAFTMNPGGSSGNLCLGGQIGRYVGPGQIQNTGMAGEFSLVLDLTQTPQPTGFVSIQAGETWNFTAWHRDTSGTGATSNFTDGLEITFQ